MSHHNILLTGASGYLGGTLLAQWHSANLPSYDNLYALVRTDTQAISVKQYNATPLTIDVKDNSAVLKAVVEHEITIVLFLIDALSGTSQGHFIKALAEVREKTGREVYFMHTSGAKLFSSHAGAPTDRPLYDNASSLYEVQKGQKAPVTLVQPAVEANNQVIEECERLGVHGYISVPCIVYGKGEGFGNKISIQTVAIVQAAKALRQVYSVDDSKPTWPVCHVSDQTSLTLSLLNSILAGKNPPSNKSGYYLGSSGSIAWLDLYEAMAKALHKRGATNTDTVKSAVGNDEVLGKMGEALECPGELVPLMLGGKCTFTARNGEKNLGWKPSYKAEHILEAADAEVALILETLEKK